MEDGWYKMTKALERQNLKATDDAILVSLGEKKLVLRRSGYGGERSWPCSFSKAPVSCVENSLGTPWGLHEVAEKYGDGAPAGTVFVGRVDTGERWFEREDSGPDQKSLVTTRILRLRGLEPGLNAGPGCDSYDRYIYIHGNNHPERFPGNVSAGCIIMGDEDLIELFGMTPTGTQIWIDLP